MTFLVMSLVPWGQNLGKRVWQAVVPTDLKVEIYSVLINRTQGDPVADVKIRLRLQNSDFSAQSVQLMSLRNPATGDSVDLSPTFPIEIAAQSFARDSISIHQRADWAIYREVPCVASAGWILKYRISGQNGTHVVEQKPADLEQLHFFLLPSGRWRAGDGARVPPMVFNRVRHLYEFDSMQWLDRGNDSFMVLIYPPDEVVVGMDFNQDGKTDTTLLAVELKVDSLKGIEGRMNSITPILDYYFDKISGFAFALGGNQILPDSVLFSWFSPSQQKDLSRVFGSVVDEQIPLIGKEFVYWQYRAY